MPIFANLPAHPEPAADAQQYIQTIMAQPIHPRSYVLDKAKQLSSARDCYLHYVLRTPHVLNRCADFLHSAIKGHFRMDSGFDVSQRQTDKIDSIRELLGPACISLNDYLTATSKIPYSSISKKPNPQLDPLIDRLSDLSIRIRHLNSWYREAKQIEEVPSLARHQDLLEKHFQTVDSYFDRYVSTKEALASTALRLVVKIAHQFDSQQQSLMDLIQDGNAGLMIATEKFDLGRGCAFTTYATPWIRQQISLGIQRRAFIRLPFMQKQKLTRARTELERVRLEQQRRPNAEDKTAIAAAIKLNERLLTTASYSRLPSIDAMLRDSGPRELDVEDTQNESPAIQLDRAHLTGELYRAIEKLDARQQMVVSLRFGLEGETCSLSSIGSQIGLTHQRVQQLEVESLAVLRDELGYLEHQS